MNTDMTLVTLLTRNLCYFAFIFFRLPVKGRRVFVKSVWQTFTTTTTTSEGEKGVCEECVANIHNNNNNNNNNNRKKQNSKFIVPNQF